MLIEKRTKSVGDIPLCSMADIAFLLLIFFLVTTTINTDKGIPLLLPAFGDQQNIPKKNIVNVLINAAGLVMIAEVLTPITQIENNIRERIKENELLIVSIKPDKDTQYEVFITVLDQIKLSGAKKISIAEIEM